MPRKSFNLTAVFCFATLAFVVAVGALGWGSSMALSRQECGPSEAKTLASSSTVRLYAVTKRPEETAVFGCTNPDGKPKLLGPHPNRGWSASFGGRFAIASTWVGGIEKRFTGRDTAELATAARDVRSGNTRQHCRIALADPAHFPRFRRALITATGTLVWVASEVEGDPAIQIGACEHSGANVIDQGPEIVVGSVSLRGSTLSWTVGSSRHSVKLN